MKVEGSYTIEAAFLVPMLLLLIVGILYIGFWVHDGVLIENVAYEEALMGANGGELEAWEIIPREVISLKRKTMKKLNECVLKREVNCELEDQEKKFFVRIWGSKTLNVEIAKPSGAAYVKIMNRAVLLAKKLIGVDEEGGRE